MKVVAALAALALAAPAPQENPVDYLLSRQQPDGGFAEPGGRSDPNLTAWVVLGLKATGTDPAKLRPSPVDYLAGKPYPTASDLALRILALGALGRDTAELVRQVEGLRRPDGRIGSLVNSTIWGVIALRSARRPAGTSVRYLLRQQRPSGGWSWYPGGRPDSNDTAAAVEALRAAGVPSRSRALRRAYAYLLRLRRRDAGFALLPGRPADAPSTAWAVQAFVAGGGEPGGGPIAFLESLKRDDGSFRYSRRYAGSTPAWVTAQVLPALSFTPYPLR